MDRNDPFLKGFVKEKMIRICYCTTTPKAIESFVLEQAVYLHDKEGWDVSFLCSEDEGFAKRLPGFIHYFPVKMRRGVNADGIQAILKMVKTFKRERFDLIQYSTPNASLYASIAAWLACVPVRLYCQWGMAYVGFNGVKRRIFKAIEKLICGLSTWIEPDSKSNLCLAHREGLYPEEKSSVIWNGSACGVNLGKFDISKKKAYRGRTRESYSIHDDAFVFGFVGRITRDKGINELFSAYKRLHKEHENMYLLLVGDQKADDSVDKELLDWSMNASSVIYTGYSYVVEQLLSAMDCYILPSYREGFGMGTIEAEAMGVPVIVTNIPGPADAMLPGKTGLIIEKGDAEALCAAMEQMLKEADRYVGKGVPFVRENFEQRRLFDHILQDRERLLTKGEASLQRKGRGHGGSLRYHGRLQL